MGLIVREVDGELLILHTDTNHNHQLNDTATIVWRMRRDGATPQASAAILPADCAVAEAQARAAVHTTRQRRESLNLLDECESTPTQPLA